MLTSFIHPQFTISSYSFVNLTPLWGKPVEKILLSSTPMKSITTPCGITLSYEAKGKKSAPAVVMIMGLGAQMTLWPDELFYGLVRQGYRVIRFDNRDAGLSSKLSHHGKPSVVKTWLSKRFPVHSDIPYQLDDMALDVLELMKALKIKKAHIVGASMGGMIGQVMAVRYPKKVLSLTSIMSAANLPGMSASSLKILLRLARLRDRHCRESAIHYNMTLNRLIGSPAYPTDELSLRENAVLSVDRANYPEGVTRQLVAITASGDRRKSVEKIKAPTLIIHGTEDPVIPLDSGIETANRIRKAKLRIVDGMGHNLPPPLMEKMTRWISKHISKAQRKAENKKRKNKRLVDAQKPHVVPRKSLR